VHAERLADPAEFLRQTQELRATEPVLTNVIGSIANSVVAGRQYSTAFWWLVRDVAEGPVGGGPGPEGPVAGDPGAEVPVVGCAMRTTPWNLVVSPMSVDAASALGRALAVADPELPGINGPREVVDAVVAALGASVAAAGGVAPRAELRMVDAVHQLGVYVPPPPVPGSARRAREDEVELLVAWHEQFAVDAGVPQYDTRTSVETRVSDPGIWWWEVDGTPVAMAGFAPAVDTPAGAVGRIGPVYTPAAQRRRGFGSAVTAAVVEQLLPRCSTVMLYADAANPTSNGVYVRLGFRQVAEIVEVALVEQS
jgi:ribosomal protein S18 acetylase RimI-like enzyme